MEAGRVYTASKQWRLTLDSYSCDFRAQALDQQVALSLTDLCRWCGPVMELDMASNLQVEPSYLDHMEFGQQIAVGQGQLVSI